MLQRFRYRSTCLWIVLSLTTAGMTLSCGSNSTSPPGSNPVSIAIQPNPTPSSSAPISLFYEGNEDAISRKDIGIGFALAQGIPVAQIPDYVNTILAVSLNTLELDPDDPLIGAGEGESLVTQQDVEGLGDPLSQSDFDGDGDQADGFDASILLALGQLDLVGMDQTTAIPEINTFVQTLLANETYAITDPDQVPTLTGMDPTPTPTPTLPTVEITATNTAEAAETPGNFTITRSGDATEALVVTYELNPDSTATPEDYTADPPLADPFTVTLPADANETTITITAINDTLQEEDETIILDLVDDELYELGTDASATLTITDNDQIDGPLLNELKINPPDGSGADDNTFEYVELKGPAGSALTNVKVVAVNSATPTSRPPGNPGTVLYTLDLGTESLGSNGLLVIQSEGVYDLSIDPATTVVNDPQLDVAVLPNRGTFFLIETSLAVGDLPTDFDSDNDGTPDALQPLLDDGTVTILDSVALVEAEVSLAYSEAILEDTGSSPDAATRFLDSTAASPESEWYFGELEGPSVSTTYAPGSNTTFPPTLEFPIGGRLTPGSSNTVAMDMTEAWLLIGPGNVIGDQHRFELDGVFDPVPNLVINSAMLPGSVQGDQTVYPVPANAFEGGSNTIEIGAGDTVLVQFDGPVPDDTEMRLVDQDDTVLIPLTPPAFNLPVTASTIPEMQIGDLTGETSYFGQEYLNDAIVPGGLANVVTPSGEPVTPKVAWGDQNDEIWLADVDPFTGRFIPEDGRGQFLGEGGPVLQTQNVSDWALSLQGPAVHFTGFDDDGIFQMYRTFIEEGSPIREQITGGFDNRPRYAAFPSRDPQDPVARILYLRAFSMDTTYTVFGEYWKFEDQPDNTEFQLPGPQVSDTDAPRWIPGEQAVATKVVLEGDEQQAARYDIITGETTVLTQTPGVKRETWFFFAPEYGGEQLFYTVVGNEVLEVQRQIEGEWTPIRRITIPKEESQDVELLSPEPFAFRGRTYVMTSASDGNRYTEPSDMWVLSIDGAFKQRCSSNLPLLRLAPEVFVSHEADTVFLSYTTSFSVPNSIFLCTPQLP